MNTMVVFGDPVVSYEMLPDAQLAVTT